MNDTRHTVSTPEPMGPFYVLEACRESALGDVQRGGTFGLKDDALRYAARLHKENGTRVYVLSNAGANIWDTKRRTEALSDEDVSKNTGKQA